MTEIEQTMVIQAFSYTMPSTITHPYLTTGKVPDEETFWRLWRSHVDEQGKIFLEEKVKEGII